MKHSQKQNSGYRAIACGVILQALEDYQATSSSRDKAVQAEIERNRGSARRFIFDDSDRVFGFLWLCQTIDMDPERIRSRIEQPNLMAELRRVRAAQDSYARERISQCA